MCAASTDKDRLRIIHLARKMRCVRYITKEVDIYMWALFVMQLKFYILRTTQMQYVLTSGLPHDGVASV